MCVAPTFELTFAARTELEKLSHRRTTSVRVVQRGRIVLSAADGMQNKESAQRLGGAPRMAASPRSWKPSMAVTSGGDSKTMFCSKSVTYGRRRFTPKWLPGRRA